VGVLRLSQAGVLSDGKRANFLAGLFVRFAVAGYFGGGVTTVVVSTIDKFTFPADTRSTLGTGLSTARRQVGAMANSGVAGYVAGGWTSTDFSGTRAATVDKITFSSDTVAALGTGLSIGRTESAGMSNSGVAGYIGGGFTQVPADTSSVVDKFAFPSDSRSTLGTGLSAGVVTPGASANNGVAGYFAGGINGGRRTTIDKFTFPADSRSTLGTGLSTATSSLTGFADQAVAGYYAGGFTGVNVDTVEKFAFPSDTRSTLGTGLATAVNGLAGMANSNVAGYAGGGSGASGLVDTVNKFAFPSDTRTTLGTGLSASRRELAGFANEGTF
jgi:hypothetical protein